MKKQYSLVCALMLFASGAFAQFAFPIKVDTVWLPEEVIFPPSPLTNQILFVGNTDKVQTTALAEVTLDPADAADAQPNPPTPTIYGNEAGEALAKQWHDFIGFTPDDESDDLGWISVNHEMIQWNDSIGDGGGMTVFKVKRAADGSLETVDQTLSDGREGTFFNVDFVGRGIGETGMNCAGIQSPDGRIWTAEEWFRTSRESIYAGGNGFRDATGTFTVGPGWEGTAYEGAVVEKYQNLNYMVEIDPKEAVAIRKQYNWGRQPFEGGAVDSDYTVYLGGDATPGFFTKYVPASTEMPIDYTQGQLYVYKADAPELGLSSDHWLPVTIENMDDALAVTEQLVSLGATMFNRLEWSTYGNRKVYMAETGRDVPASRWSGEYEEGATFDLHYLQEMYDRGLLNPDKPFDKQAYDDILLSPEWTDRYGRILVFDLDTDSVTTFLPGGPFFEQEDVPLDEYPEVHLSNMDGLLYFEPGGSPILVIQEDLNGTSHGRVPAGIPNRTCEMYVLDLTIENPTVFDLCRIAIVPIGAEVTGAARTFDNETLLANSQHPSSNNPFPYNNSLTFAINGWNEAVTAITSIEDNALELGNFVVYPNPVSRELKFSERIDAAIYNVKGERLKVFRNKLSIDVSDLTQGTYILMTSDKNDQQLVRRFIVQ